MRPRTRRKDRPGEGVPHRVDARRLARCGHDTAAARVNGGPLNGGGTLDLSDSFREIAPPLVRLHDCHWPNPDVVDVHVVFPDFKADPEKAESYDFARTDEYLKAVLDSGSGIVFRLGESIEHQKVKTTAPRCGPEPTKITSSSTPPRPRPSGRSFPISWWAVPAWATRAGDQFRVNLR